MPQYRFRLIPLEAYHFAKEMNFWAAERTGQKVSNPYYVPSDLIPTQTTLLGMMRYLVLKQSDLLGNKGAKELQNQLIGEASFDYTAHSKQSFGVIQSLSSVYLECAGVRYIAKPANLRSIEGMDYYQLQQDDSGQRYISDFSGKEATTGGFLGIDEKGNVSALESSPFSVKSKTRINKQKKIVTNQDDDAFFKVEMVSLKKGFVFEGFVEMADSFKPESDIVFMGSYQAAFAISFERVEDSAMDNWHETVQQALTKGMKEPFYYALSDVYIQDKKTIIPEYGFVGKRHFRNLKTVYEANRRKYTLGHSGESYTAGSVFYGLDSFANEQVEQIGLNKVLKIGE